MNSLTVRQRKAGPRYCLQRSDVNVANNTRKRCFFGVYASYGNWHELNAGHVTVRNLSPMLCNMFATCHMGTSGADRTAAYRERRAAGESVARCAECGQVALSKRWAHLQLCCFCGRQTEEYREEQRQRMRRLRAEKLRPRL